MGERGEGERGARMEAEAAPTVSAAASRPPLPPKGFESPTPKLDEKIRADLILHGHSRDSTPEPAFRTYFNGDVPMSPSTAPTDVAPSKMSFRLTTAMSPMFGMTKPDKSPGALASESSTPAGDAMSPTDPSPLDKGPDGKKPTCGACEMLGHLLDNTVYDKEAKQVVENLRSDDTNVVLMTAKALSDFCDVFCVGVDQIQVHRSTAGKLPGLWDNLAHVIESENRQANGSDVVLWAVQAVGLIAFRDEQNIQMVGNHTDLLHAIASVMREGSEPEKAAACGAICNVCAHGNTSSIFAECRPLVLAILDLSKGDGQTRLKAVGCFTNMSCGDRAREVLHEYDGITAVLKEITNLQGQGEHHEVLLARATMALANLTGSFETSQIVARPEIIRTIITCLKSAIDQITVGLGSSTFGSILWTVSIVLFPIYQLAIADANKLELVNAGVVSHLLHIMMLWREGEGTHRLEWTLLALRQLCFEKECKSRVISEMLKSNTPDATAETSGQPVGQKLGPANALEVLENIIKLDPPSELERTRDTGGSLSLLASNLKEQMVTTVQKKDAIGEEGDQGKWVMISYNWDVQKEAKELCAELQSHGYVVWMDILDGCMAGDTLEAMANAVGKAAVVIILVTYKYKQSANCRREASYAQDLRKVIVPVVMEPDYEPNATWGWLGLVIAGKKTYDLRAENLNRKEQIQSLIMSPELEQAPKVSSTPSTVSALATTAMHLKRAKLRAKHRLDFDAQISDTGQEQPVSFVRSRSAEVGRRVTKLRMSRVVSADGASEHMPATDQESHRTKSSATVSPLSTSRTESGEEPTFLSLKASSRPNPYDFAPFQKADSAAAVLMRKKQPNMSFVMEDSRENLRSEVESFDGSSTEFAGQMADDPLSNRSTAMELMASSGRLATSMNGEAMLRNWLRDIDVELEQYHVIFTEHKLTYELLSYMTENDLSTTIEPEIPVLGHRLLLRQHVERLRRANGLRSTHISRQSSFDYQPSPIVLGSVLGSVRTSSHRYMSKSYDSAPARNSRAFSSKSISRFSRNDSTEICGKSPKAASLSNRDVVSSRSLSMDWLGYSRSGKNAEADESSSSRGIRQRDNLRSTQQKRNCAIM